MKTLLRKLTTPFLFLIAFCGFAACKAGTGTAAIGAGAAGVLAVFDQMFSAGSLTAEQHTILVNGVRDLTAAAAQAITPGQAVGGLAGLGATLLGIIRLWRGRGDNSETPPAAAVAAPAAKP